MSGSGELGSMLVKEISSEISNNLKDEEKGITKIKVNFSKSFAQTRSLGCPPKK